MAEKSLHEMSPEELLEWDRNELGGAFMDDDDEYNYTIAVQVAMLMEKDVEAFKKLPPEEQEEKYREYKKEMDALTDEELNERHEKYFS